LDEVYRGMGADGIPDRPESGLTYICLDPGVCTRELISSVMSLVWSLDMIVKADEVNRVNDSRNTLGDNCSFFA
jgi:hypothetical protein